MLNLGAGSLEVLVSWIFISVHLHVGDVTFLRAGGLINLNETLKKINVNLDKLIM